MSALGQKRTFRSAITMSALPPKVGFEAIHQDVRFSNRPVWVKRFQTIHRSSVDVARGLVLLFGIGAKALVWDLFSQEV
jgi:hypothetical protein